MKRIVCYSGGHSSALVAIEVSRRFGNDGLILLNHDIIQSSEGIDIKRFKTEVSEHIGLPITYANMPDWDKKDQFDVVIEAGAFKVGNGTALCSNRMKTRPFEEWLHANADPSESVIYYGFDGSEKTRIQRRIGHLASLGYRSDYPLALWVERTIHSVEEIGISKPNVYESFKHANCAGCLKAGKQHWYVVYCTRKDIWEKAKISEDEIGYTIIKDSSLSDLEEMFEQMRLAGVPASEHIPYGEFWRMAKEASRNAEAGQDSLFPCECVL